MTDINMYYEDSVNKYAPAPRKTIHDVMPPHEALNAFKCIKKHKLQINYVNKPDYTKLEDAKRNVKARKHDASIREMAIWN